MKKPNEPIEEIVWTGASDRAVQPPSTPPEPPEAEEGPAEPPPPAPYVPPPAVYVPPPPPPASYVPAMPAAEVPPPPAMPLMPPMPPMPVTPPVPPKAPPPSVATPANKSRALAETVVASFLDRLTAEAERRGGSLSVRDIQALSHEFEKKTEALQVVFEKSFEDYVRARERSVWDQKREFPFDRQIIGLFSHLFPGPGGTTLEGGALSRRMVPAFLVTMNLMLGHDVVEDYQNRCRKIVEVLKKEHGEAFSWQNVDDSRKVNEVVLDAVIGMANHFEAAEKRSGWFLHAINDHLGPPNVESEGKEAANWQLTDESFPHFMGALFSVVREGMSTETGRLRITMRHGGDTTAVLFDILKRLDDLGLA
jgi:hypothetical protein